MITLYRKNAIGIGMWSIWNEDNVIHMAHSSTLDGAKIHHTETVKEGKQSRTLEEQVVSRILSRVSKQKDKGYTEDLEQASKQLLNQLGLELPMLAKTYENQSVSNGVYIQRKLDGLRCLAKKENGQIILYSRKGKKLDNLDHIANELKDILPEGETFDGELYCHGIKLQTIQSWVKRLQPNTKRIRYYVYDIMSDDGYEDRYQTIADLIDSKNDLKYVVKLPAKLIRSKAELNESMSKARQSGFEGLMIKLPGISYANGKRSSSLLKFKEIFSDECICTDVALSDKGFPVCKLVWNGKIFYASPPGGHKERNEVFENKSKYIGSRVTFEYRELTEAGIPFHAQLINWRGSW